MSQKEPTTTSWERARKPEQIEIRRDAILDAARSLLERDGIDGAGLSSIAREVGLSKANLYRYFESREAILLEILGRELQGWVEEMRAALSDVGEKDAIDRVADAMVKTLSARVTFSQLLSSLATVLEQNLSKETIIQFKRIILKHYFGLIPDFKAIFPRLSLEQIEEFLLESALFQTGLWPHTRPSDVVREVWKLEEFAPLRIDFEQQVRRHTRLLLRGLESEVE